MAVSLGKRLKATREALGMTQEQVIEQLENRFDVEISQQTLSTIETGKRKVDAEKELPAFAAIYGRAIDYFYESLDLLPTPSGVTNFRSSITVDFDALTQRDKLELAAELIHTVLQET
jgi:transcriptional regulator with XRE-family HTH domain